MSLPGLDLGRVTAWLVEHVPPVQPPLTAELIAGGRSNLTYAVTDAAGRRLVLRRPPTSHVLATAHDVAREHRIIAGLTGSRVPLPRLLGLCEDVEVNGAPFYVMAFAEGHVLRGRAQAEAALTPAARATAGEDLVDVLARLHAVDVDAAGLGDLARRDGYLHRQLTRWHRQFQHSQEQERQAGVHRPADLVEQVHAALVAAAPEQQAVAVVHGDYRLDNTVVGDDGRVRAVLDWELCTLGDPLADVGILLAYWAESGDAATAAPGFPDRAGLAARYAERSPLDLSALPYYVAFAHWKLACIVEGVYLRYATGAMGQADVAGEVWAQMVLDRAAAARDALEALA